MYAIATGRFYNNLACNDSLGSSECLWQQKVPESDLLLYPPCFAFPGRAYINLECRANTHRRGKYFLADVLV
jgi:hypothetical protein